MRSERAPSKLSENQKINVVGQIELKLWPFKDTSFNATLVHLYITTNTI